MRNSYQCHTSDHSIGSKSHLLFKDESIEKLELEVTIGLGVNDDVGYGQMKTRSLLLIGIGVVTLSIGSCWTLSRTGVTKKLLSKGFAENEKVNEDQFESRPECIRCKQISDCQILVAGCVFGIINQNQECYNKTKESLVYGNTVTTCDVAAKGFLVGKKLDCRKNTCVLVTSKVETKKSIETPKFKNLLEEDPELRARNESVRTIHMRHGKKKMKKKSLKKLSH